MSLSLRKKTLITALKLKERPSLATGQKLISKMKTFYVEKGSKSKKIINLRK